MNLESGFDPQDGIWVMKFQTGGHGGGHKSDVYLWPAQQYIIQKNDLEGYTMLESEAGGKLPYTRHQANDIKTHIRGSRDYTTLEHVEVQHWAWLDVNKAKEECTRRKLRIPVYPEAPVRKVVPQSQPSASGTQPSRSSPHPQSPDSPSLRAAGALMQINHEDRLAGALMELPRSNNRR